jgi:hypothetical protein
MTFSFSLGKHHISIIQLNQAKGRNFEVFIPFSACLVFLPFSVEMEYSIIKREVNPVVSLFSTLKNEIEDSSSSLKIQVKAECVRLFLR